jgi:hypothetical protein
MVLPFGISVNESNVKDGVVALMGAQSGENDQRTLVFPWFCCVFTPERHP